MIIIIYYVIIFVTRNLSELRTFGHQAVEVSPLRKFGSIVGPLLAVAVVLAFALVVTLGPPDSSKGVTLIGDNIARVPKGETLVLTYTTNTAHETWELTHDGSRVVTTCSGLCANPAPATLCGIDCEVLVDAGVVSKFRIRLREDGAVNITWPDGWLWAFRSP